MKKLFFCLCLLSFLAIQSEGQTSTIVKYPFQTLGNKKNHVKVLGMFSVDSIMKLPKYKSPSVDTGLIAYWNGYVTYKDSTGTWYDLGRKIDLIDSVKKKAGTDSVFYYRNGVGYLSFVDGSSGSGWNVTGNSGTTAGTNFIGTTDAVDVVLKANNTERARVLSTGNVGIGLSSPAFKLDVGGTSSVSDRKIGINGLPVIYMPDQAAYSGSLFYGTNAINLSNSGGGFNGAANTALGINAMDSITTGFFNTAFGNWALHNNTSGDENSAFGLNALKFNTTGEFNTAVGTTALFRNTTGQTNTAIGNQALRENTTGLQNTAVGYRPLQTNTTGYFNTAVAYRALEDNTTGYGNSGFGLHALSNNTTGYYNSAFGFYAGDVNLTGRNNNWFGTYAGNHVLQKNNAINQTVVGGYAYGTRDFSLVLGSKDSTNVTELNGKDSLIVDATLTTIKSVTSTGTYTGRWKARVGSTTSSATPTINTDNFDIYKLTAQAADITSFTTNLSGTPNDGDILEIQITGTAARAITWGSSFVSSTVTLPTTTVTTATLTVVLQYFTTSSYGNNKWVCVNSF